MNESIRFISKIFRSQDISPKIQSQIFNWQIHQVQHVCNMQLTNLQTWSSSLDIPLVYQVRNLRQTWLSGKLLPSEYLKSKFFNVLHYCCKKLWSSTTSTIALLEDLEECLIHTKCLINVFEWINDWLHWILCTPFAYPLIHFPRGRVIFYAKLHAILQFKPTLLSIAFKEKN